MELLQRSRTGKKERPIKVLQYGDGNFLRGFVDYMIDIANEKGLFDGDIVLVKPRERGTLDRFHQQECQYTVSLRGIVDGEAAVMNRIITSVADAVAAYEEYENSSLQPIPVKTRSSLWLLSFPMKSFSERNSER